MAKAAFGEGSFGGSSFGSSGKNTGTGFGRSSFVKFEDLETEEEKDAYALAYGETYEKTGGNEEAAELAGQEALFSHKYETQNFLPVAGEAIKQIGEDVMGFFGHKGELPNIFGGLEDQSGMGIDFEKLGSDEEKDAYALAYGKEWERTNGDEKAAKAAGAKALREMYGEGKRDQKYQEDLQRVLGGDANLWNSLTKEQQEGLRTAWDNGGYRDLEDKLYASLPPEQQKIYSDRQYYKTMGSLGAKVVTDENGNQTLAPTAYAQQMNEIDNELRKLAEQRVAEREKAEQDRQAAVWTDDNIQKARSSIEEYLAGSGLAPEEIESARADLEMLDDAVAAGKPTGDAVDIVEAWAGSQETKQESAFTFSAEQTEVTEDTVRNAISKIQGRRAELGDNASAQQIYAMQADENALNDYLNGITNDPESVRPILEKWKVANNLSELGKPEPNVLQKALYESTEQNIYSLLYALAGRSDLTPNVETPTLEQLQGFADKIPTGNELLNMGIDAGMVYTNKLYAGIGETGQSIIAGANAITRLVGLNWDKAGQEAVGWMQTNVVDPLHKGAEYYGGSLNEQLTGLLTEWGVDQKVAAEVSSVAIDLMGNSSEMYGRTVPIMLSIWAHGGAAAAEGTSRLLAPIKSPGFMTNWLSSTGEAYQNAITKYGTDNVQYSDAVISVVSGFFDAYIENYETQWGLSNGVQSIAGTLGMPKFGDFVGGIISEDMEEVKQLFSGDVWENVGDLIAGRPLSHPLDGKTEESMFNFAKYLDTIIETTGTTFGMNMIMGIGNAKVTGYVKALQNTLNGTATEEERNMTAQVAAAVGMEQEDQKRAAEVKTPTPEEQHNTFENTANGNEQRPAPGGTDARAQAAVEESGVDAWDEEQDYKREQFVLEELERSGAPQEQIDAQRAVVNEKLEAWNRAKAGTVTEEAAPAQQAEPARKEEPAQETPIVNEPAREENNLPPAETDVRTAEQQMREAQAAEVQAIIASNDPDVPAEERARRAQEASDASARRAAAEEEYRRAQAAADAAVKNQNDQADLRSQEEQRAQQAQDEARKAELRLKRAQEARQQAEEAAKQQGLQARERAEAEKKAGIARRQERRAQEAYNQALKAADEQNRQADARKAADDAAQNSIDQMNGLLQGEVDQTNRNAQNIVDDQNRQAAERLRLEEEARAAEQRMQEARAAEVQAIVATNNPDMPEEEREQREQEARDAIARREEAENEYREAQAAVDALGEFVPQEEPEQPEQPESNFTPQERPEDQKSELVPQDEPAKPEQPVGNFVPQENPEDQKSELVNQEPPEKPEDQVSNLVNQEPSAKPDDQVGNLVPQEKPEEQKSDMVPMDEPAKPDDQVGTLVEDEAGEAGDGQGNAEAPKKEEPLSTLVEDEEEEAGEGEGSTGEEQPANEDENEAGENEGNTGETQTETDARQQEEQKNAETVSRQYGWNHFQNGQEAKSGVNVRTWNGDSVGTAQAGQLQAVDWLAKRQNVIVIADSTLDGGLANGKYNPKDGRMVIHIAQDSADPLNVVFSHELMHLIQANNPKAYGQIEKAVFDYLRRAGVDISNEMEKLRTRYKNAKLGVPGDAVLREEIVANSVYDAIGDKNTIRALAAQDRGLVQRIHDWVQRVMKDIREMMNQYTDRTPGAKALQETEGAMERLRAMIEQALNDINKLNESKKTVQALGENGNMTRDYQQRVEEAVSREELNGAADLLAWDMLEEMGQATKPDNRRQLIKAAYTWAATGGTMAEALQEYGFTPWGQNAEMNRAFAMLGKYAQDAMKAGPEVYAGIGMSNDSRANADRDQGVRYAIKSFERDGKTFYYVESDRKVIKGNDPEEWAKQLNRYFDKHIRQGKDVTVKTNNGVPLTINDATQYKSTNWNQYENGEKYSERDYKLKLRMEAHIDEIAEVSHGKGMPDNDYKDHTIARDGWSYRRAYFRDYDGKYYSLQISVGKTNDVNTVYNVNMIKKELLPNELKGSAAFQQNTAGMPTGSSNNSKPQNAGAVKFSLKNNARDQEYQQAIDSGNKRQQRQMVNQAAQENGYDPKVDLYHGTRFFGYTAFNTDVIWTTTNEGVAAGYANHGRVRATNSQYVDDHGDPKLIIQNAKNVLGSDYEQVNEQNTKEIREKRMEEFRKANDKLTDPLQKIDQMNLPNEMETRFWDVTGIFQYLMDEDDAIFENRDYAKQMLGDNYGALVYPDVMESYEKLRDYYNEHREEIQNSSLKDAFEAMFNGYEVGDALIEYQYSYRKLALGEGDYINTATKAVASEQELKEWIDREKGEGVYKGYGKLGDRPLIVDANKAYWLSIKAQELGDGYYSTDQIVKWAKANGYTSVVIKNVMDPAIVNDYGDDYVFFNSSQFKSSEPITYDNDGNVIPLSERFNDQEQDIRWSVKDRASAPAMTQEELQARNRELEAQVFDLEMKVDRAEEAGRQLVDEVMRKGEEIRKLRESKATLADIQNARKMYKAALENSEKQLMQTLAYKEQRDNAVREQNRLRKMLGEQKAEWKAKIRKQEEGRVKHQQQMIRINKALNKLNSMMENPSKNKGWVPQESQKMVADFILAVSEGRGMDASMLGRNVQRALMREDSEEATQFSKILKQRFAETMDLLDEISKRPGGKSMINKAEEWEINAIMGTLEGVVHEIQFQDKLIGQDKAMETQEAGRQAIEHMEKTRRQTRGVLAKLRSFGEQHLNPSTWLDVMAKHGDNIISKINEEAKNGQRKMEKLQMDGELKFLGLTQEKNESKYRAYLNDVIETKYTAVDFEGNPTGKTMRLNHDMLTSLYMHWMSPENREAMKIPQSETEEAAYGERFQIAVPDLELIQKGKLQEAKANATRYVLTEDQMKALFKEHLTDYDRQWCESFDSAEADVWRPAMNETSMKLYGWEVADVDKYYPITRDQNYIAKEFESVVSDNRLTNMGKLKKRVTSSKPVILIPMTQVVAEQNRDVSRFAGLAIPVRDMTDLYNVAMPGYGNSVKEAMKKNWGTDAAKYYENLVADLQGARDMPGGFMSKLRSAYAKGVLSMNASVTGKQAASAVTAAGVVHWSSIGKALRTTKKAPIEQIQKYTAGYYMRTSDKLSDMEANVNRTGFAAKGANKLMTTIEEADKWTTRKMMWAAVYEVQDHMGLKEGSEEYWQTVAKVYDDILEVSQPTSGVMQKDAISRSTSETVKSLTMFRTQISKNLNAIVNAATRYSDAKEALKTDPNNETLKKDAAEARRKMAGTISGQVTSAIILSVMTAVGKALFHKMRDYEDDKGDLTPGSVANQMLKDAGSSFASMIVGGSELYDLILGVAEGKQPFDIEAAGVSTINDLYQNTFSLLTAASVIGDGSMSTEEKMKKLQPRLWKFAGSLSEMLGIPLNNARNLVDGIAANAKDIVAGKAGSFQESGLSFIGAAQGRETSNAAVAGYIAQAMMDGDQAEAVRLYNEQIRQGKSVDALNTAIATWQKANIPEIKRAAEAIDNGDLSLYNQLINELTGKGLSMTNAVKYVEAERKKMTAEPKKEEEASGALTYQQILSGMTKETKTSEDNSYTNGMMNSLLEDGNVQAAMAVRDDMLANGKTKSSISSSLSSFWKPRLQEAYAAGDMVTVRQITQMLVQMGLKHTTIQGWTSSTGTSSSSSSKKSSFGSGSFGGGSFGSSKKSSSKKSSFGSGSFGGKGFGK